MQPSGLDRTRLAMRRGAMRNVIPVTLLALLGCASYKKPLPAMAAPQPAVEPVVYKLSENARLVRLVAVVFDLPIGHQYGEAGSGTGGRCYRSQPMMNTKGRFELDARKDAHVFNGVVKKHGYAADEEAELFKDSKERVADLQVGAKIVGATLNECYPDAYENDLRVIGSSWLKIEWSVYSPIEKKVLFTTVTEGSTYGEVESRIGEPGILRPAVADSAERLALNDGYRNVVDPPKA